MPPVRIWSNRPSIYRLIGESYLDVLLSAKTLESATHIYSRSDRLQYLEKGIPKDSEILPKIKAAVESLPYVDLLQSPINTLISDSPDLYVPVLRFIKNKWLDEQVFFEKHILPAVVKAVPVSGSNVIKAITEMLISHQTTSQTNMLYVLKSLPQVIPDHPLSGVWEQVIQSLPQLLAEKIRDHYEGYGRSRKPDFLEVLLTSLHDKQTKQSFFTPNDSISILSKAFEKLLELKSSIVASNPASYTEMLKHFLEFFLKSISDYSKSSLLDGFENSELKLFDPKLIDRIILEYVKDPVDASSSFNQDLKSGFQHIYLNYLLLLSDLKLIGASLPNQDETKLDDFGFWTEAKPYVVPALPSSKQRIAEKFEGKLHAVEFHLFRNKLLTNPDEAISQASIHVYYTFISKLLSCAYQSESKYLCERATEVFSRYTRFCLGVTRTENEQLLIQRTIQILSSPIVYVVGFRVYPDFIEKVVQPLINQMPQVSASMVSFSKSIVLSVLENNWETFPDVEEAVSRLAVSLHRSYAKWVQSSSSSREVSVFTMSSVPIYLDTRGSLKYIEEEYEHLATQVCTKDYIEFTFKHIFSKKRNISIKFEKAKELKKRGEERHAVPKNNYEFLSRAFSPSITFALLKDLVDFANRYVAVYPKSDECNYMLSIQSEVLKKITASCKQVYYGTKSKAKIDSEAVVDKNSVKFLYEITNSSSFFHRLASKDLESIVSMIYTLQNFHPTDRLELNPPEKTEVLLPFSFSSELFNFYPVPSEIPTKVAPDYAQLILKQTKEAFTELTKSPLSFYAVISNLIICIKATKTRIDNPSLIGDIISLLIQDFAIDDATRTKTIFSDESSGHVPVPKWTPAKEKKPANSRGRRRAARVKPAQLSSKKTGCLSFYNPNEYLLAGLFDVIGLPIVRLSFTNFSFIEAFQQFMELPPDEQSRRLGLDRKYFFPQRTVGGIISYVDFGETEQPFGYAKKVTFPPLKILYSMFGSDVFHHSLIAIVSDFLLMTSSIQKRRAITSTLLSVLSLEESAARISISSKIQLLALVLSPQIVGFPLPDFTLQVLKEIASNELLHIDIRRVIISSIISYFNFQSVIGEDKYQVDELFEILDLVYKNARDATVPFFCCIYDRDTTISLTHSNDAIAQLLTKPTLPCTLR